MLMFPSFEKLEIYQSTSPGELLLLIPSSRHSRTVCRKFINKGVFLLLKFADLRIALIAVRACLRRGQGAPFMGEQLNLRAHTVELLILFSCHLHESLVSVCCFKRGLGFVKGRDILGGPPLDETFCLQWKRLKEATSAAMPTLFSFVNASNLCR